LPIHKSKADRLARELASLRDLHRRLFVAVVVITDVVDLVVLVVVTDVEVLVVVVAVAVVVVTVVLVVVVTVVVLVVVVRQPKSSGHFRPL